MHTHGGAERDGRERQGWLLSGYFFFDLWLVLTEDWGAIFVWHAVAALLVFLGGLRPFLHYVGTVFLLYELSTPLMNLRRHLIEVMPQRQDLIAATSYVFAAVFFSVRIVFGLWVSFRWWAQMLDLWSRGAEHSHVLFALYLISNAALNGMNVYWFYVMISVASGRTSTKQADLEDASPALREAAAAATTKKH